MQPKYIDCHTHTHFAGFTGETQKVIARALAAGVGLINVGTQRDTSKGAVEVAKKYPNQPVYAAVGLHPTHTSKSYHDEVELGGGAAAKAFTSRGEELDYEFYLQLAKEEKVVAIGECGLDYYYTQEIQDKPEEIQEYKEKQILAFQKQIQIAKEVKKPLMIHCRPYRKTDDAYEDLLNLLASEPTVQKVLHFYVGSLSMTKKFLEADYYFEFGGVITFTKDYDEQIKLIPLDRILLETDAPYVAPVPYRGQRNEPAYVVEVAKKIAQIKGLTEEEVAAATTKNAQRLFQI